MPMAVQRFPDVPETILNPHREEGSYFYRVTIGSVGLCDSVTNHLSMPRDIQMQFPDEETCDPRDIHIHLHQGYGPVMITSRAGR